MKFDEAHDLLKEIFQCGIRRPRGITISYMPDDNEGTRKISEGFRLLIDSNEMTEPAFNCIRMIVQVRKLRFRWLPDESRKILEIYSPIESYANI